MAHTAATGQHVYALCDCRHEILRVYEGCGATMYIQRARCCPILLAEQARDRAVEARRRLGTRRTRDANVLTRRQAADTAAAAARRAYDNLVTHYAALGTYCSLDGIAQGPTQRYPGFCERFVSDCADPTCVANDRYHFA